MALLADSCLYRSSFLVSFCLLGEVHVCTYDPQAKYDSSNPCSYNKKNVSRTMPISGLSTHNSNAFLSFYGTEKS